MSSNVGSVAPAGDARAVQPPGLVWDWSTAALGAVYALPGAVVVLSDRSRGLALVVGVLPAAIVGLMPTRRGRLAIVVLGTSIGVPMFLGGLLAGVPVLAVLAIAGLGVGSALLAARFRLGQVAMTLSLPMVGIGLSYSNLGKAAALAGLMVLGSAFACLVSMLWPEHAAAPSPRDAPKPTLGYGVRLGGAGATAAAIGFLLDLEHVGWACAAALLVMRPAADMQRLRSVGRIVAVAIGALAAIGLLRLSPSAWAYSLAAIAAVAGAGATHRSRWYVTPAFTTFLVFLLLLYSRPQDAASRFNERVLETLLGVGIAYAFGLGLPAITGRLRRSDDLPRD
jgi:Fusaric acid resistance protein-like